MPWDSRAEQKKQENKRYECQDLRIELRRLWDKRVEIVPIIIGALGTIPKSLKRNLEELGADVAPGLLQKSGAGDSTYNQKSDGHLRRQDAARRTHIINYQLVIAVMEQKKKIIIILITITRGALSRAQKSLPGSVGRYI